MYSRHGAETRRSSRRTFHRTFTLLNDGIPAASGGFSAFGAHSGFSLCANAETDPPDHHPDTGRRAFLNDPASLRSRFLNDVVVRKARRNDKSCQGSTSQNCSHWEVSLQSARFSLLTSLTALRSKKGGNGRDAGPREPFKGADHRNRAGRADTPAVKREAAEEWGKEKRQ